jgi:DNA repair protein RadC
MAHSVRERLQFGGPQSLSTDELLAALWGSAQGPTELAQRVIVNQGGLDELARAEVTELSQVPGVGQARAAQVVAAFELGRRVAAGATIGRWTVRAPSDVNDRLAGQLCALDREELHVLLLNTKNAVLRQVVVYRGNVSTAVVRIGELFRDAVRAHAAGVVIVHNHPSGDPEPSADDAHLTAEAIAAGRLLDVTVLDHIVIASGGYVSLRDRGVAFDRQIR